MKIKDWLINNAKIVIFFLILVTLNIFFSIDLWMDNNIIHNFEQLIIVIVVSIIIETGLTILIYHSFEKKWKIEKLFLSIALILGTLYLLIFPLGRIPDERNHFLRAYEISEGHLLSDKNSDGYGGRKFVNGIDKIFFGNEEKYSDFDEKLNINDGDKKSFYAFSNTSLYSFICYLPQVVGISIGKILQAPIIIQAYLGRLFNLLTWIALIYFALKFIPFKKIAIVLISFLPITLQEAASLAPDAFTFSTAFALICYIMHFVFDKKSKLGKKEFAILSVLSLLMAFCKIVYLPLCFLTFLIPKERFKSKKDKFIKLSLLCISVIVLNLIWLAIASGFLVEFQEGVNSGEQVKFVLTNPFLFIQIFFNTLNQYFDYYLYTMFGKSLGNFDISISWIYIYASMFVCVYTLIKDNESSLNKNLKLLKWQKIWLWLILLGSIALIYATLYVQWSSLKSPLIQGVQGRYFLPLLIIPAILLYNKKNGSIDKSTEMMIWIFIIFENIYSLMVILNRFI